jgi:predicted RNA-binding protein YlqC (UPF0109 family)
VIVELVEYLCQGLVRHGDQVSVASKMEEGRIDLQIQVADDDYGRLIGRGGQTIAAVRTIASVVAAREGLRVSVDATEPEGRRRS